jgi:hypothetical protein
VISREQIARKYPGGNEASDEGDQPNSIRCAGSAGAQFAAKRSGRKPHGSETRDQHGIVFADPYLLQTFINSPEAAGDLRVVSVGEFTRQVNQVLSPAGR